MLSSSGSSASPSSLPNGQSNVRPSSNSKAFSTSQLDSDYSLAWQLQAEEHKKVYELALHNFSSASLSLQASPVCYQFQKSLNEILPFTLRETVGDGDCFFHAVNKEDILNRKKLVDKLLENAPTNEVRKPFALEIRQFLYLGVGNHQRPTENEAWNKLTTLESKELFSSLERADNTLIAAVRKVRAQFSEEETRGKAHQELLSFLEQKDSALKAEFKKAYQAVLDADEVIYKYCCQENIFKKYVELYLRDAKGYIPFPRDFGIEIPVTTIDVINQLFGLKIQVYLLRNRGETQLQLANPPQTGTVIPIFHNGINHFSGLEVVKLKPNVSRIIKVGVETFFEEEFSLRYQQKKAAFLKHLDQRVVPYIKAKKSEIISCFISYAWAEESHSNYQEQRYHQYWVEQLAELLNKAGVTIFLDKWEDGIGKRVNQFIEKLVEPTVFVLVVGTKLYLEKYQRKSNNIKISEHIVKFEAILIEEKLQNNELKRERVLPILLEGKKEESFTPLMRAVGQIPCDFVKEEAYFENIFKLIQNLYGIDNQDMEFKMLIKYFNIQSKSIDNNVTDKEQDTYRETKIREKLTLQNKIADEVLTNSGSYIHSPRHSRLLSLISERLPTLASQSCSSSLMRYDSSIEEVNNKQILCKLDLDILFMNDTYVLREELQASIRDKLFNESQIVTLVPSNISKVVSCYGIGGIGKTFAALGYITSMEAEKSYKYRFWIDAEKDESIKIQFEYLAKQLKVPLNEDDNIDSIITAFKNWLDKNGRWLIVFDNAENYDAIKNYIPPKGGHVLITSQNQHSISPIPVDIMSKEQAIALYQKISRQSDTRSDIENLVVGKLECFPLVVAQVAAYANAEGKSATSCLKDYSDCSIDLLKDESLKNNKPGHGNHDPMAVTMRMVLGKIKIKNPKVINLLKIVSFMYPDNIPLNAIEDAFKAESNLLSQAEMREARRELTKYSIIKVKSDSASVHRVVQNFIQGEEVEQQEEKIVYINLIIKMLNKEMRYDRNSLEAMQNFEQYITHASTVLTFAEKLRLSESGEAGSLYHNLGVYYLDCACDFEEAKKHLLKALAIRKKIGRLLDLALTYRQLSATMQRLHDNNALGYANDAFKIYEQMKLKGESDEYWHVGYIRVCLEIAKIHNKLKNFNETKNWLDKAWPFVEAIKDKADISNATEIYYYYAGDLEYSLAKSTPAESEKYFTKALEYYRKSLDIKLKRYSNKNHPEIARSKKQIGSIFFELKQLDEAEKYYKESIDSKKQFYQTSIRKDIADDLEKLGRIYDNQEKKEERLKCLEESLNINEKLGKVNSYDMGNLKYSKAKDNKNKGLEYKSVFQEAEQYYEIVFKELESKVNTRDKVQFASIAQQLGAVNYNLEVYERAFKFHEIAFKVRNELSFEKPNKEIANCLCLFCGMGITPSPLGEHFSILRT